MPFPINFPELYEYYVPMDAVFFLSIYDNWGMQKLKYFMGLGLKTQVLRKTDLQNKGMSASWIRALMANGEPWEDMVPPVVCSLLKTWNIPERIRKIRQGTV